MADNRRRRIRRGCESATGRAFTIRPQADEARLLPYLDDLRGEAVNAARMVLANRQGLYALVPHADA